MPLEPPNSATPAIAFVLVEPETPENVGAAARALKTMGFHDLRLVRPQCDVRTGPARYVAHGSHDIIDNARVFASLAEAIADCDVAIATVSVHRRVYRHYYPADSLREQVERLAASARQFAVVFGRESSGLTNDEIGQCDLLTSAPMACDFPSLNLAQSVMVFAYLLAEHRAPRAYAHLRPTVPADSAQFRATQRNVGDALRSIGVVPENRTYTRVLGLLGQMDFATLQLINYLARQIQKSVRAPQNGTEEKEREMTAPTTPHALPTAEP